MKELDIDNLTSDQQNRMCELCELRILGCKHSTSTFLCEGSRCEDAFEYLIDDIEDKKLEAEEEKKEKYKYLRLR